MIVQNTKNTLDTQVLERLNLPPSKSKEHNVLNYIINSFLYSKTPLDSFKELSKKHFVLNCGSRYLKQIKSLESKNIIQINHSYRKAETNSYSKSYRINPQLFGKVIRLPDVQTKISRKPTNRLLYWTQRQLELMTCSLSGNEVKQAVKNLVDNSFINARFKPAADLDKGYYYYSYLNSDKSKEPRPLEHILKLASKSGYNALFCTRKRIIYLGPENKIKDQKKQSLRTTYLELLTDFTNGRQTRFIDRSTTNDRLTTAFTVFPSDLLKYLKFDGQNFLQVDISNSQFCILANLIKSYYLYHKSGLITPLIAKLQKQKDYYDTFVKAFKVLIDLEGNLKSCAADFIEYSINGRLYEFIADTTKLTRSESKKAMFVIAFASHRYNPEIKKKVRKAFESVICFIDLIKKELPKKDKVSFPVLLQKIESYICIDNVLQALKKNRVKTLTRHDSFCVTSKDSTFAEIIICGELSRLLPCGYSLKKEYSHEN